jgi:uncharacterized membrane protein
MLKKYFGAGLVVLLPIALTFWIVSFIIEVFTAPFLGISSAILTAVGLHSVRIIQFFSYILALVFLFFLIICIGAVGRHFFFKYLGMLGDSILHRIPLVSTIYKTSQELINTLLTSSNKSFKQVVMVPYPTHDNMCIGFVTRDDLEMENRIAVFVPTTPNPTSGFLMICDKKHVIPLDMKVEEALRYVISCGVLPTPIKNLENR